MLKDVVERLRALKVALLRRSPFLAFSLDNLNIQKVDDDDPRYITIRGDALRIYRNVEQLQDREFAVRVIKAIIHGVMGHGIRARKLYRSYGYNTITRGVAVFAANIVAWRLFPQRLRSEGFSFDSDFLDRIFGNSFDWRGASMEEIFKYLVDIEPIKLKTVLEKPQVAKTVDENIIEDAGMGDDDKNNGDGGGSVDSKSDDSPSELGHGYGADLDKMLEIVNSRLQKIAAMTVNFGKLAGTEESDEIRRLIESLLKERPLPWNVLLRRYLQGTYQRFFKTSWKRESRKVPDMLPGYERFGNRTIVAVDVSGSISDEEYATFCREVLGIARVVSEVVFVCWDVKAKSYGVVRNIRDMERKSDDVSGYGGTKVTCLSPILKDLRVGSNDVLIILTDGHFYETEEEVGKFMKSVKAVKVLVTTDKTHKGFDMVIRLGGE